MNDVFNVCVGGLHFERGGSSMMVYVDSKFHPARDTDRKLLGEPFSTRSKRFGVVERIEFMLPHTPYDRANALFFIAIAEFLRRHNIEVPAVA